MEEPKLNYNLERGIELEVEGKYPELAEFLKDIGRKEEIEKILTKILEEAKEKEKAEEKKKELEERKNFEKLQKEYLYGEEESKEHYEMRMEIISLLAKKERRRATEEIVKYIKRNNYFYTIMEDEKNEVWYYDEGVYVPCGKNFIQEKCRAILRQNFTNQLTNEVIAKIEADTFINKDSFFSNCIVDEIPLENGILQIKTKKLLRFDPKKIFFNKLPVEYNPEADCPYIKKHFQEVLKNKDDVKVMFEIFGFFLYKDYFIEKAIMFVGDGRNGKGKTIDLMKRFLGANNCSSVPLNAMTESNFRTWDLFGKMANLAGDLSSNALRDTSILKQTTGRDLIGADRKRKSTVNFVNHAKHVFACNELPRVYDFSRGFWDRWVLFEFPYTFVKEEDYETLKNKGNYKLKDPFIMDKLTTKEELSGLLNEALEGLQRILKQKDFSYSKGINEIKNFWVRKSDSFTAFAMDNLEESYEEGITKAKLRKSFNRYCKEHKLKGVSDRNIKTVLEELFGVTEKQDYESKLRIWEGIKFKETSKYKYSEGKLN